MGRSDFSYLVDSYSSIPTPFLSHGCFQYCATFCLVRAELVFVVSVGSCAHLVSVRSKLWETAHASALEKVSLQVMLGLVTLPA